MVDARFAVLMASVGASHVPGATSMPAAPTEGGCACHGQAKPGRTIAGRNDKARPQWAIERCYVRNFDQNPALLVGNRIAGWCCVQAARGPSHGMYDCLVSLLVGLSSMSMAALCCTRVCCRQGLGQP